MPSVLIVMELVAAPVICKGLHCVISRTFSFMQTCQITSIAKAFTVFFSLLNLGVFIQSFHKPDVGHLEITGLINSDFKTTAN